MKRQKTGGRQKGTPNKHKKADVLSRLQELDCDPIAGMVDIAENAKTAGDFALAGSMYKELAQYIAPKLKAIEHTGTDGEPLFNPSIVFEVIDAKAPEANQTAA